MKDSQLHPSPFSVLLLYPDGDTYYAWVMADNAEAAIDAAKTVWAKDNPDEEVPEFEGVLVLAGHITAEWRG